MAGKTGRAGLEELERSVEQYLRRRVEQAGGRCVKFDPGVGERGWPDRIVLLPGGLQLWVETKRPRGGRVSAAQRVAHEGLRRLGQRVEIVLSKVEVDEMMHELLHGCLFPPD
jgi:hypothetical protein